MLGSLELRNCVDNIDHATACGLVSGAARTHVSVPASLSCRV